jgi:hypothetical protein
MTVLAKSIADRCRSSVLPNDGIEDRFAGRSVPNNGGFALVGYADGRNVLSPERAG